MGSIERVTLFGDIKGVNVKHIRIFVEATDHLYGGSYPSREEDLQDEEVVKRTRELLSEAGILNPDPVILCSLLKKEQHKYCKTAAYVGSKTEQVSIGL